MADTEGVWGDYVKEMQANGFGIDLSMPESGSFVNVVSTAQMRTKSR